MKRRLWSAVVVLLAGCGLIFAIGQIEQAIAPAPQLASMLPEGALLSIESPDFSSLLKDWNSSAQKRAWILSDNYAAFSNSRLFSRLSQAQDEFSAAAGLPAGGSLLERVAGKQSCLGLYDIGNLEFVYITRLNQQAIEGTPLWQTRSKYEQRTEAGTTFYVHKDEQSARIAAFASKNGWLILATREDLLAGRTRPHEWKRGAEPRRRRLVRRSHQAGRERARRSAHGFESRQDRPHALLPQLLGTDEHYRDEAVHSGGE